MNRAALEFGGVTESDVLGQYFWEAAWFTHDPVQQARIRKAVLQAATGQFVRLEAYHPGPEGSTRYIDASIRPIKDESGKVVLLIPEGRDITERKLAEEETRKLAAVVKHSGELINLATVDGKMIFLNDAGGRMLGIDPQEIEDVNIMDVIPQNHAELVEGDIEVQTKRVLENVKAIIEAAGFQLENVVKCSCFLSNMEDFVRFNSVYESYFGASAPARETVEVSRLPKDVQVEVSSICGK